MLLLQKFIDAEAEVAKAYLEVAITEAEIAAEKDSSRKDIGKLPAPNKDGDEPKYLKLSELAQFINKLEDVVDTELETLRNHILSNTSARKQTLDLDQFLEHIHQWALSVWRSRVPPEQMILPSNEAKEEKSTKSKSTNKKSSGAAQQDKPTNENKSGFQLPLDDGEDDGAQ